MGVGGIHAARLLHLSKSTFLVLKGVSDNDGRLGLSFQFMLCDHKLMDDFPSTKLHFLGTRDLAKLMRQMWLAGWIQLEHPTNQPSLEQANCSDLVEKLFRDISQADESPIALTKGWAYDITQEGLEVWDSIYLHNVVSGTTFVKCQAKSGGFGNHYCLFSQSRDRLIAMTSVLADDCDVEIIIPVSKLQFEESLELWAIEMPGPWYCEVLLKKSFATTLPFAIHQGLYHRNDVGNSWTIPQLPGTFLSRVTQFQQEMDKMAGDER